MSTMGYLGPAGTHSEAAAMWLNERSNEPAKLKAFPDIFSVIQAVEAKEIDSALVPVENSIEGAVNITFDTLAQCDGLHITREVIWAVHNQLMSASPSAKITAIYSHPQPLAQCRGYIKAHFPSAKLIPTASTAEAAKIVSSSAAGRGGAAAICTARAGKLNGLTTIAEDIQDLKGNCTRFYEIRLEPHELPQSTAGTALIIFQIDGTHAGTLYDVLGILAKHNVNMTRIESRPSRQGLGIYIFFLDLEIEKDRPRDDVEAAIAEVRQKSFWLKDLGRYPVISAMPN